MTLHIFPARYAPVEPHTCVPGATVCQQRFWLEAWARLGVRNRFQSGDPATVVARKNREYLLSCTNHLTKREIRAAFGRVFARVDFCEREFLECGQGAGQPRRALAAIPGVPELYSAVRGRVLFTKKAPLDADRTR